MIGFYGRRFRKQPHVHAMIRIATSWVFPANLGNIRAMPKNPEKLRLAMIQNLPTEARMVVMS